MMRERGRRRRRQLGGEQVCMGRKMWGTRALPALFGVVSARTARERRTAACGRATKAQLCAAVGARTPTRGGEAVSRACRVAPYARRSVGEEVPDSRNTVDLGPGPCRDCQRCGHAAHLPAAAREQVRPAVRQPKGSAKNPIRQGTRLRGLRGGSACGSGARR